MASLLPRSVPWGLCLLLSLFYIYSFYLVAIKQNIRSNHAVDSGGDQELLFGFCVWGEPYWPDETNGCHGSVLNSHMASFAVDIVMTLIVCVLWRRLQCANQDVKGAIQLSTASRHFLSVGAIILMHGVLHFFLFYPMDCYANPSSLPMQVIIFGYIVYFGFSAFLFCILFTVGFGGTMNINKNSCSGGLDVALPWPIVGGLVCGAATVLLALFAGSEWVLTSLFAMSHMVASIVGSYARTSQLTDLMGWTFLVATLMGVLELLECFTMYRAAGGHVWYDFFLHISVITSLPPFVPISTVSVELNQNPKQRCDLA